MDDTALDFDALISRQLTRQLSLAEGYMDIDLNRRYIKNRAATYLFQATENTVEGIHSGDVLVIDRSLKPVLGCVLVAEVEGELMIRRLQKIRGRLALVTDKAGEPPHYLSENAEYCQGIVTVALHHLSV